MVKIRNKKLQAELSYINEEIKIIKSGIEKIKRCNKKLMELAYNCGGDSEIARTIRKDRYSGKYRFDERFPVTKD